MLIWVTLPAVAARRRGAGAGRCPAGCGRCGCCGCCVVHLTLESLMLVDAVRAVDRLRLRPVHPHAVLRAHPLRPRADLLWVLFREARRVLAPEDRDRRAQPRTPTRATPLLVFCRHAGPGDSFTLIYALMHWYDREPRVVLKDTLAWDPAIDVLLNRLPSRFISPQPRRGQRPRDADRRPRPRTSTRTTRS